METVTTPPPSAGFAEMLAAHGRNSLLREHVTTLQVNVGKLCNQACHHCHVEAGPKRTEIMRPQTAERIVALLERSPRIDTVDLTGGAPELNRNFRFLVESANRLGRQVIDRCNLTVLFEPEMQWLPEFLARNAVELICSLPCYSAANVDRQRGSGVFEKSIRALRWLNALGYGHPDSGLRLNLVYNPIGPSLPPSQAKLEADYKHELFDHFGICFNRLFTITNMPIGRFAAALLRSQRFAAYMSLLVNHFNPATIPALMCRSLISVGWDGSLYDCDFNQMLGLRLHRSIWNIESFEDLSDTEIVIGDHCFGCTAGAGSSCGGALE